LGPFVSNGNFDWWQVGIRDLFRLDEVLKKHPEGVYFSTSFTGAVADSGEILGFPPIHMHHIHISPEPGVKKKLPDKIGLGGYIPNLVIEQHGDYECLQQEGGVNCFFEKSPVGYVKEINRVLDLEGEMNDARAPNSKPMTWWYQVAIRWHPKSVVHRGPVSQNFLVMVQPDNVSDQLTELLTFNLDTSEHHIAWYSGTQFSDGGLVRNKMHSHNVMFDRSFFFRASPKELGLVDGAIQFPVHDKTQTVLLRDTGLSSFEAAEEYLMSNLAKAASAHVDTCETTASFLNARMAPQCSFPKPFTVCRAWARNEEVFDETTRKRYLYDRRAKECCKPWAFRWGERFTTVAFYKPLTRPLGPWLDAIPPTYPEHLHWVMSYVGPEAKHHRSFYTQGLYPSSPASPGLIQGDGLHYVDMKLLKKQEMQQRWPDHLSEDKHLDDHDMNMVQTSLVLAHRGRHRSSALTSFRDNFSLSQRIGLLGCVIAILCLAWRGLARKSGGIAAEQLTSVSCLCAPPCCPRLQTKYVQKLT
jgi:hypothetical protein